MSYDAIARCKGCMGSWSDCEAWRGGVLARPRWRSKMYSQDGLAPAARGSLIATVPAIGCHSYQTEHRRDGRSLLPVEHHGPIHARTAATGSKLSPFGMTTCPSPS